MNKLYAAALGADNGSRWSIVAGSLIANSFEEARSIAQQKCLQLFSPEQGWIYHDVSIVEVPSEKLKQVTDISKEGRI